MDGDQPAGERNGLPRSSHTSGHMTTRRQRIEVITGCERRRRWSIEEKREIVAESLRPGVRPSEVMRKHGISSGQLYAWRQQLTRRLGRERPRLSANFARVAGRPIWRSFAQSRSWWSTRACDHPVAEAPRLRRWFEIHPDESRLKRVIGQKFSP